MLIRTESRQFFQHIDRFLKRFALPKPLRLRRVHFGEYRLRLEVKRIQLESLLLAIACAWLSNASCRRTMVRLSSSLDWDSLINFIQRSNRLIRSTQCRFCSRWINRAV